MVGHTGVLPAVIKAVETVDACLGRVLSAAERAGACLLVTADHGNCELMIDPDGGGPHTAHTTNPVPFVVVDPAGDRPLRSGGAQVVGFPPDRSPYRDRDHNRDWTFFGGQFSAERDPLGVAPTDGPMAGVRWQMHMTGPMYFGVRLAGASVDRTIIDPAKRLA